MRPALAPDWSAIINDLTRAGVSTREIGEAMCQQMTDRMMSHYRNGTQPAYWRGKLLVDLWCVRLNRLPADVPQAEVIRGHRAKNREHVGPKVGLIAGLTDWLKPTQKAVKEPKQRRKAKVEA